MNRAEGKDAQAIIHDITVTGLIDIEDGISNCKHKPSVVYSHP